MEVNSEDFNVTELGNIIRSYRKNSNMTQNDVAKKVGLSSQHYSRIERGEYVPSLQTFFKLVKTLNVNLFDFEISKGEKSTPVSYEIIHILKNFDNEKQKAILTFLQTMKTA